jgi:hypothetical protein
MDAWLTLDVRLFVLGESYGPPGVASSGSGRGVQREALQGGTPPFWVLKVTAWVQADGLLPSQRGTGGDAAEVDATASSASAGSVSGRVSSALTASSSTTPF